MRSRYLNGVFAIFTAILMITFGPAGISAQGKGHGGGNRGGGGGQPGRGNPVPQIKAPQPRMEMPRPQQQSRMQERRMQQPRMQQMPQMQQQQAQQRRQQIFMGPPARIQRPEVNARRQNPVWQDRGRVRTDQPRPDIGRRQDRFPMEQNRPDFQGRGRQTRIERGNDNGIFRQERRNDRVDNIQRGQGPPTWSNAWPNNYGYDRSSLVHERNDMRRALRNDQRALRSDNRVTRWFTNRYADLPEYRQNRRVFEDHERWRENFLRNIVVNVRLSNAGYLGYDPYYSGYAPAYYGVPYDPAYYGSVYYNAYPGYAAVPYYYDEPVVEIGYSSGSGGYAYYADPYYDDFPYAVFTDPYNEDDYSREVFGQYVAYGYEQGYEDGLAARRAGYGTRYFDDPFVYNQVIYDPYSYSLGENRRCLSKGYELGYADALYGGDQYDPYRYGDVDLVSAFVVNALAM